MPLADALPHALAGPAAVWWSWIAPLSVQAAVLATLVLLLDRLLARRGWPQLRHALWLLAALRFVLPPTLTSPVGIGSWLAAGARHGAAALPGLGDATSASDARPFDASWLFTLWLAGAAAAAAIALRQRRRARGAFRGEVAPAWIGRIVDDAARRLRLRHAPRVVVTSGLSSACVRGLLRPIVALPEGTPAADVEPMLLHELAHVKRRDLWVEAALAALRVAFWFHPAAWLVGRRVARVREMCCDATVAAALGPRADRYRATLLRAAARLLGDPSPEASPGPAFLGLPSQIVERLRSLERGPGQHPRLRAATSTAAALLLGVCVLPMARPTEPGNPRLDAARSLIASAMDGSARPGCLRLRFAAMALTADAQPRP